MTETERRSERQAIMEEEAAQRRRAEITERALNREARFVERNADVLMTSAETQDPRVKGAISHLADQIRLLA